MARKLTAHERAALTINMVGIPVGLVLCAVIVFRLFDEERRLAADLPGYEEYRQKVLYRIVPGIR